jgi:hypothetical protein
MARVDDYKEALRLASAQVREKDPEETARLSGARYDFESKAFHFSFLGRDIQAGFWEPRVVYTDTGQDADLPEKVLVYHYLHQAKGVPALGRDVDFRELPGGEFYHAAFDKRAQIPLVKTFGSDPDRLTASAPSLGGEPLAGKGDAAARFQVFPRVSVTLIVWGGDDEFEPSGKILFDPSIKHYLTTEDAAWAASMVVYKLMRTKAPQGKDAKP